MQGVWKIVPCPLEQLQNKKQAIFHFPASAKGHLSVEFLTFLQLSSGPTELVMNKKESEGAVNYQSSLLKTVLGMTELCSVQPAALSAGHTCKQEECPSLDPPVLAWDTQLTSGVIIRGNELRYLQHLSFKENFFILNKPPSLWVQAVSWRL